MRFLNHNDRFLVNGTRCFVFYLPAFCAAVGYDEAKTTKTVAEQRKLGHGHYCGGIHTGSTLFGDKAAAERDRARWADAPILRNGELVEINGERFTVKYKGRYSDAVAFVPVPVEAV